MKTTFVYMLEIGMAVLLLWIDARLFWLYAFIVLVWLVNDRFNRLRRMVRVFQVANESKLLAVCRKLGVTPAEIEAIFDETKADVSDKAWESLERDFKELDR